MRDRYETLGKNTTYKRSSVRGKFFFNCNSSLSCADSELIPVRRINISSRYEQHRGKQRRISCLVSVKLREAVRMV